MACSRLAKTMANPINWTTNPIPFATAQDWHDWLASNPKAREVWVLLHKKDSGVPSIT